MTYPQRYLTPSLRLRHGRRLRDLRTPWSETCSSSGVPLAERVPHPRRCSISRVLIKPDILKFWLFFFANANAKFAPFTPSVQWHCSLLKRMVWSLWSDITKISFWAQGWNSMRLLLVFVSRSQCLCFILTKSSSIFQLLVEKQINTFLQCYLNRNIDCEY